MHKEDLTGAIISAIIIAAFVLMLNPQVMERIADAMCNSALAFLRAVDRFTVDYQLQRGIWEDVKGQGIPEAERDSGD